MIIKHSIHENFILSNDEDDLYKFDPDKEPWWNR